MKQKASAKKSRLFIAKEVSLAVLALLSLGTVAVEIIAAPGVNEVRLLNRVDFVIACIFLVDFAIEFYQADHKLLYLKKNWYLLLAAIPFTDTVTDTLRGLRILRLLRIIRAGEHIDIGIRSTKY